jgi:hypothetical protein
MAGLLRLDARMVAAMQIGHAESEEWNERQAAPCGGVRYRPRSGEMANRGLYEKLIEDADRLEWFLREVVSEEWHAQHDAGVPLPR